MSQEGWGEGKKDSARGPMGRGREEASSHSPPRAYCYFHWDTKTGASVEERGATAIFPLEGDDGAVVRALASQQCGLGSNSGVDDICGC